MMVIKSVEDAEARKMKRLLGVYNMIPNLIWTALFVIPIFIYCYKHMAGRSTYLLLGISLATIFLPNSFFDFIQLSKSPDFYKKLGVRYINILAQNGSLLNKFLRKKDANFKMVSNSKASIRKQYYQTYFFEKFHFALFLFYTGVTIYAGLYRHFEWVLILIISNLFYNIYPNLLQQYIRVRLKSAIGDKK